MSGSDAHLMAGVAHVQQALKWLPVQPMHSWIDLETGGYCVGRAMDLTLDPQRSALVQHWHSGRVELLGPTAALTLLPYPAEPITEPEGR